MNLLAPFTFERQMFHGLQDAQNLFPWVGEGGFNPPSPLARLPLCCSFSMGQPALHLQQQRERGPGKQVLHLQGAGLREKPCTPLLSDPRGGKDKLSGSLWFPSCKARLLPVLSETTNQGTGSKQHHASQVGISGSQSEAGEQVCLDFEGGIEKQVTQEVQGCHTSFSVGCWRSGSPGCCFRTVLGCR